MRRNGFTLVELLVVISIIGILSTVVLTGISGANARARDTERKGDLRNIKVFLETYFADQHPNKFNIPDPNPSTASALSTGLTTDYLKSFPTDPSGKNPYLYQTDATGANFAVMAALENTNDSEKKSSMPAALGGGLMASPYNFWEEND